MSVYAVRLRLGAALVALTAVMSGCGGDPPSPPPFTPSTVASSPTSTPTSTPTGTGPVEPVLPDAAKAPTAAGAEAFARFYWEMAAYAQSSGDTSGVRPLGAITCAPCSAGASGIDRVYHDGGVIRGGEYATTVVRSVNISSEQTRAMRVVLTVRTNAQEVDYPGTKRDRQSAAGTNRIAMILNFLDGGWTTVSWEVL